MSGSRAKKDGNVSATRHRMLEELPDLHLDLDSPNFSKDVFIGFVSRLVGGMVSGKKARGLPILPQISEIRDVRPVRITAYGTTISAAIRCDDLYVIGFKSSEEKWFGCKLDNTPAGSTDSKGKGKCDDDEEPFIEGAVKMHFTGSYNAMLLKKMHTFKFSIGALKSAVKYLGKVKSTDLLDDKNPLLLQSFALVCLFISEPCRFKILGDTFMALADDPSKELAFADFNEEIRRWGTHSYTVQHNEENQASEVKNLLRVLKFQLPRY